MLAAIDIGNSCIKTGIYNGNTLIEYSSYEYNKNIAYGQIEQHFIKLLHSKDISDCVIASVVDEMTELIIEVVNNICNIKPYIINSNKKLGINIKAESPERIGVDRIVNAIAASKLYSFPLIVVDFGTATTFDIVNSYGDFIGGIILPGINTQLKSLAADTSKLPKIDLQKMEIIQTVINTNTEKAILSGVLKGHAHAIDGLIQDCSKELGSKPMVILTGGFAEYMSKYIPHNVFDYVNPTLTLEGIKQIYEMNIEKQSKY